MTDKFPLDEEQYKNIINKSIKEIIKWVKLKKLWKS
jgi:hypothetical protein